MESVIRSAQAEGPLFRGSPNGVRIRITQGIKSCESLSGGVVPRWALLDISQVILLISRCSDPLLHFPAEDSGDQRAER